MRITAALTGNLYAYMKAQIREAEKATSAGVKQGTDGLKNAMRGQVTSSGMGRRLANTWRGDLYPRREPSLNAAGFVYTKAPKIMQGLENPTTIRSKDGFWLAIPTPNAPKRGVGGKRINPSNFPEHRFGRLHFVYRANGPSLLVVENVGISQKTGRITGARNPVTKTGKTAKGVGSAIMFWLVPAVCTRKRIHFAREAAKWQRQIPGLIVKNWKDPK